MLAERAAEADQVPCQPAHLRRDTRGPLDAGLGRRRFRLSDQMLAYSQLTLEVGQKICYGFALCIVQDGLVSSR